LPSRSTSATKLVRPAPARAQSERPKRLREDESFRYREGSPVGEDESATLGQGALSIGGDSGVPEEAPRLVEERVAPVDDSSLSVDESRPAPKESCSRGGGASRSTTVTSAGPRVFFYEASEHGAQPRRAARHEEEFP
jgi:hypothetical protein